MLGFYSFILFWRSFWKASQSKTVSIPHRSSLIISAGENLCLSEVQKLNLLTISLKLTC